MEKCGFEVSHYEYILNSAKGNGYKFCSFSDRPAGKAIYLRHDIDIDPKKAVLFARIENKLGIRANYFVEAESENYNLLEKENIDSIREVFGLGHNMGLHFDANRFSEKEIPCQKLSLEKHFTVKNMVSFHKPKDNVLNKKFKGFISAYEPFFFSRIKYISDSKGAWREGCACFHLNKYEKLQILTHPVWWI